MWRSTSRSCPRGSSGRLSVAEAPDRVAHPHHRSREGPGAVRDRHPLADPARLPRREDLQLRHQPDLRGRLRRPGARRRDARLPERPRALPRRDVSAAPWASGRGTSRQRVPRVGVGRDTAIDEERTVTVVDLFGASLSDLRTPALRRPRRETLRHRLWRAHASSSIREYAAGLAGLGPASSTYSQKPSCWKFFSADVQ